MRVCCTIRQDVWYSAKSPNLVFDALKGSFWLTFFTVIFCWYKGNRDAEARRICTNRQTRKKAKQFLPRFKSLTPFSPAIRQTVVKPYSSGIAVVFLAYYSVLKRTVTAPDTKSRSMACLHNTGNNAQRQLPSSRRKWTWGSRRKFRVKACVCSKIDHI